MSVGVTRDGPVVRLRLDRPEKRNALDAATWQGLRDAVRDLADDGTAAVVVLEAAGTVFCAGVDIKEPRPDGAWQERRVAAGRWQRLLAGLEALPQVTIAAVQGAAVGGGVMLTLACDLRVAAETATFRVPELNVGQPVAWGSLPLLVRAVGVSRARDLVLGGRALSASEAADWGLVQRVVPDDTLAKAVDELVTGLAEVPLGILSQTKQALATAHLPGAAWADADRAAAAHTEEERSARR